MLDFSPLARIPKHIGRIKALVFLLALLPLLILINEFYQDDLGVDPLDRLTRLTGNSALVLLILSLTITPLRHFLIRFMVSLKANYGKRLADWNWIIKLRRMIGVMSFFYAVIHFVIYFWLDQGLDFNNAFYDIKERYFIAVGLTAFILLIPLALTSTNKMMRMLGRNWRKLHRTVYLIAILSMLHFWMLTKVGVYDYVPYVAITFFLLGWRAWYYSVGHKNKMMDDGMEAIDREQVNRIIKNLSFLADKTFGDNEGKAMVSILFKILSSETHFSETILHRDENPNYEITSDSRSMMKRLGRARRDAKLKVNAQSVLGVQIENMPEILELVENMDNLLKQGMALYEAEDETGLRKVWTDIFSLLMPVPGS